jgi:hypothetical protein
MSSPPPSPYTIYNDRDATILDQLLIARPNRAYKANEIIIHLSGTTAFSEKGARKVAKWICGLDEQPIVRVEVASSMLDFEFVNSMASIIYLQGKKPEFYVHDPNHRIQLEAFNNHCRQLQQNEQKEYNFDQSLGKAASIQFAMSLHGNTALKKLTLRFDNDLSTDQDLLPLAAGICHSAVSSLAIWNMCISSTEFGGQGLRVLLQQGIQASGRLLLESLEIHALTRTLNTSGLAEIIPCVETLSLKYVHFGLPEDRSQFHSLCEGLGRTSNLLGLTLERCNLDDDATRMLFNALLNHRSMTTLNLAENHIGDAGIAALVEFWPEDSRLEVLDLRGNQIATGGVQQLMTALPNRRAMKTLILLRNGFGFDEVEMIGIHLPNLKIREICIGEVSMLNGVTRTRVMHSWLRGIQDNHFLQTIFMTRNRNFRLELMDEIVFYTKLNKYGRYLRSIANDVPPALWCLIFAKARIERDFNLSMIFYFLVEQPHLVNERKRRKRRTVQPTIVRRSARLRR